VGGGWVGGACGGGRGARGGDLDDGVVKTARRGAGEGKAP